MRNIGEIIEAKEIVWNQGSFPLSLNTMFELNDIIISPDMMAVQSSQIWDYHIHEWLQKIWISLPIHLKVLPQQYQEIILVNSFILQTEADI